MKKLFGLIATIAMCLFAANASAQSYIPTITSSGCIVNGAGDVLTSGTLIIVGTDQNDNPIPYRVNGAAQATTSAISRVITNGAIVGSLQLANPALTSPVGVLYRIAIQDSVTKKITLYKQVIVAANSGSNFDLCVMNTGPSFAPVTVVTNPGTVNGNTVQNGDFTINGRFITTMQTIASSATPIFDCSLTAGGSFFKMTLSLNVTSSTLVNCSNGQDIALELCQDATGSRTFVAPTNIQGFVTIPSTLSTCTVQLFKYDGGISKAVPDSTSALAVNGVSYPAAPSTHAVPVVTAANTVIYKVVPDCTDVTGNHLNYTQSTDTWSCGTSLTSQVVTLTGTQAVSNKTYDTAVASGNVLKFNGIQVVNVPTSFFGSCTGTAISSSTIVLSGVGCSNSTGFQFPSSIARTMQNLRCHAVTGGVNASSGVVSLRKNGVASALTCTFGTGTSCTDVTHTVAFAAADLWDITVATQATETLAGLNCQLDGF